MKNLVFVCSLGFAAVAHAFSVQVESSQAQPVQLEVNALGTAISAQSSEVRTRAEGAVQQIFVSQGEQVEAGQLLVQLSDDDYSLNLDRARQEYRRVKAELDRAQSLFDQKLVTRSALDSASVALKGAESALANARQAVEYRKVTAPFDGVVSELHVEEGEVVGTRSSVLQLIDPAQIKVVLEIPQSEVAQVQVGQSVRLEREGALPSLARVSRVASMAAGATRMFEVDVVPTGANNLRPGMSVSAQIQVAEGLAHFVSPAWLFLNDEGVVGIKAVDDSDKVLFFPVDLIRADAEGFFVAGLPEQLDVITVGGGFVKTGAVVEVAR